MTNETEWLKRQLTQREIPFQPLDNGIRSSEEPARVQRIADTLDATKIDAVFRKWLRRLPHPFAPAHRAAGYRCEIFTGKVLNDYMVDVSNKIPGGGWCSTAGDLARFAMALCDGRLVLGTWQQVFLLECDVRPRERTVYSGRSCPAPGVAEPG